MNEIFLLKHEDGSFSCYSCINEKLEFEQRLKDMDEVYSIYPACKLFGIFIYAKGMTGAPILVPEEVTN